MLAPATSPTTKAPIDWYRLFFTLATVVYLAIAAQIAIGPLLTSEHREMGPITLDFIASRGTGDGAAQPGLTVTSLIVDGRLLRFGSLERKAGWTTLDNGVLPSYLTLPALQDASFTFSGKRFVAVLDPRHWSGWIRVSRNGKAVQVIDVAQQGDRIRQMPIEDPVAPPSNAVFLAALLLFGGCAWRFGPWRTGRQSIAWMVFFLAVLHLLYWASQPVGTNNDSRAYFLAGSTLWDGTPDIAPPGYGILLWVIARFAGSHLGAWATLVQHGMVVIAAVWLYRLLRRIVSENLALTGAILAGVLGPAMKVTQGLYSEAPTAFVMVGALYFAVRAAEKGKLGLTAGILIGWAGLMRVVPLAALIPAVCAIYLLPKFKSGLPRLATTATAAALIFGGVLVWFGIRSGEPKLTNSVGMHLFNRVFTEQRLIDSQGPATQRLVKLAAGKDPRDFRYWEFTDLPTVSSVPYRDLEHLMGRASLEGIRVHPVEFGLYTMRLAWRTFFVPTDWIAYWAETIEPVPNFETAPLLPYSAAGLVWRWKLDELNSFVWPFLCRAATAGAILGLFGTEWPLVLALAWIPIGYLLPTACADVFCPRYNAPIVPLITVLALLPLEVRLWERWVSSKRSRWLGYVGLAGVILVGAVLVRRHSTPPIPLPLTNVLMIAAYCALVAAAIVRGGRILAPLRSTWPAFGVALLLSAAGVWSIGPASAATTIPKSRVMSAMRPDPRLGAVPAPNSSVTEYYSGDARGLFREADPRESFWQLRVAGGNAARMIFPPDDPTAVRIEITRASSPQVYDIQLNEPHFVAEANSRYVLTFRARADRPRQINAGFARAHDQFDGLGFYAAVPLTPAWQNYSYEFQSLPTADDANARVFFDFGQDGASADVAQVLLRRKTEGTDLNPTPPSTNYTVNFHYNSLGCRGGEYADPKPAGVKRVLMLGNSSVLGAGISADATVAASLEQMLNSQPPGAGASKYEVINCAESGYSPRQDRLWFEQTGTRYHPDIVLTGLTWRDGQTPGAVEELRQLDGEVRKQSGRLAIFLFRNNADYPGTTPSGKAWNDLTRQIRSGLEGTGIAVLDTGRALADTNSAEDLKAHATMEYEPNEIAHAMAARALLEFLTKTAAGQ